MSAADRLNEIEARARAAELAGVFESEHPPWDAYRAVDDSADDVPALVAALRAVLQLHRTGPGDQDWCVDCGETSPCSTVRAIEEALR